MKPPNRLWSVLLLAGAALLAGTASAAEERIIVSGASGQLGELTVEALLARGVEPQNLILVSRTPEKLARYAALGAVVRFGDLTKPESLPAAYAGGTRMIMISIGGTPTTTPRPELHERGFRAAVQAGVRRIAYSSIIIAELDMPLAKDHRDSEVRLEASGASWTHLRNGQYYEFNVLPSAIAMAKSGQAVVPANETRTAPITRADCAAVAAAAILDDRYENAKLAVAGPEVVGITEIAAAVTAITGKPIALTRESTAPAAPATAAGSQIVKEVTGRAGTGLREFLLMHKAELEAAARN